MIRLVKIIAVIFFICMLTSCAKQEKNLTPQQINQKVDSIVALKEKKLRSQAHEDLNRRMSIEIKPKVDSILNRTARPDSVSTPVLDTSGDW